MQRFGVVVGGQVVKTPSAAHKIGMAGLAKLASWDMIAVARYAILREKARVIGSLVR